MLFFRRIHCTHAAYGTVTLYDSSWWPVGTQLESELTVGGRLLVGVINYYSSICFGPYMLIFRRIHCTHAAYGTVTLYDSSWWPVGTQLE